MTRGFISVLNGDFKAAYEYNVLSIPLFICIFVYCVLSLIDFFFDKNYIYTIEKYLAKKCMYFVYVLILIIATIINNA